MKLPVKAAKDGITLQIYAQPGAASSGLCGLHDDRLKIRLAAKALDGAANQELCRYLATWLRVPRWRVSILHGATGRRKSVHVAGDPARLSEIVAEELGRLGSSGGKNQAKL